MVQNPLAELPSSKLEDMMDGRISAAAKKQLNPQAFLVLSNSSFDLDCPKVVPMAPGKQKLAVRETRVYYNDAQKLLKYVSSVATTALIPDVKIAEIVGQFGRDKEKVLNTVNLENALIIYVSRNKKRLGKKLFADPVFVTLVRLYFGEYIGQLAILEKILNVFGERGFWTGYGLGLMQKEYEDIVEWEKFANIIAEVTDKKPEEIKAGVRNLRKEVEKNFLATQKKPAGTQKWNSAQKLLAFLERSAAATFTNVEDTRKMQQALDVGGGRGHGWIEEGKLTMETVDRYLSVKRNPRVLNNKDFLTLTTRLGVDDGFTMTGIQSGLMQLTAQAVEDKKEVDELIKADPTFRTLLRLYASALTMRIGITELMMVVFGETGVMTRARGNRFSKDLNPLIDSKYYLKILG